MYYFGIMLSIALVSKEIEAYQLFLFVPEWPHWLLHFNGFTFDIKTYCYLAKNFEFRSFSVATFFSPLMGICSSWYLYFTYVLLLGFNILSSNIPTSNNMFKINNRNTRTRCEICSKLTIKTPVRRHWPGKCRLGCGDESVRVFRLHIFGFKLCI